jgi:hypothetical protein
MAQKAGLMPNKDKFAEEKKTDPTKRLNCYWDEKSIDVQWNERTKRTRRQTFTDLA